MHKTDLTTRCLDLQQFDQAVPILTDLLHCCVHQGASIGFVLPFSIQDGEAFWQQRVRPSLATNRRVVIVAEVDGKIAGSVQLDCDLMPNQKHRADVSKLLVHPSCRRQGIARTLMAELERQALKRQLTLLVLDTRTCDAAQALYASIGFEVAGTVPGFALDPFSRKFDATTYMFKKLRT
ncbi:GNAT family N-acetyltransferase [Pararhizobium sp. IMCC21322]|uniref:GNAT family N-acetyltransferase n=1 Tax=Pararhizobium sp. IMCC21322 TaxID=3067903 RepID=UPI00274237C1|nr:GNAT family N-acetyltransferase [Pararhizobium sp. IMCC21322]